MINSKGKKWYVATLDPKGQSKGTMTRQRRRQALKLTNKMMQCSENGNKKPKRVPLTADVIQMRRIDAC